MSIIQNKDIYDSSQGNPLQPIVDMLEILDKKAKEVKISMQGLETALKETAKTGSGTEAKELTTNIERLKKKTEELTAVEKAELSIKKQLETVNAQLIVLESKESKELEELKYKKSELNKQNKESIILAQKEGNEYKKLSIQLNNTRNDYKNLAAAGKANTKEAKAMLVSISNLDTKLKTIDNQVGQNQRSVGKYTNAMQGLGGSIKTFIAGLGVSALINFGKSIINTRAEFQKYSIVLENTLGSSRKAADAIAQIEEFAAKTPFSVAELTDSFIKLTNQGFQPTTEDMTKLGDLASSTGKSFEQLTEAILDAQTGEFERLKEFGIKTKKEGDKLTFTFKEQKTTVDNSAESIRKYLLSLGEMPGVMGANEKIAQGLTGQISNLGDSWDRLLNTLGKIIEKPVSKALNLISGELNNFGTALERAKEPNKSFVERLVGWLDIIAKVSPALTFLNNKLKDFFGIEEKLAKLKADKNAKDKDGLITQDQYNAAKQRGIEAARKEIEANKAAALLTKDAIKAAKDKEKADAKRLSDSNKYFEAETKRLDELEDRYQKERDIINEFEKLKADAEIETLLTIDNIKTIANKSSIDGLKSRLDAESKLKFDALQKDLAIEAEINAQFKELRESAINESTQLASKIFSNIQDERLSELASQSEAEKEILKDKLDKGVISEEEYNNKISAINKRQRTEEAKAEKKKALFDILINTAVAVAKSLAKPWLIPGIIVGGAIQAAAVAAAPIPAFAEGTEYLTGEINGKTGGTIIEGHHGERILTANQNKGLLGIKNKDIPNLVQQGLNSQKMEQMLNKIELYTAISAGYLSNGRNSWSDEKFVYNQEWKNGEVRRKRINKTIN